MIVSTERGVGKRYRWRRRRARTAVAQAQAQAQAQAPVGEPLLANISPLCEQLLVVAAAVGVAFALSEVAVVLQRPVVKLLPAVSEALKRGVLVADGSSLAFSTVDAWQAVVATVPAPVMLCLREEVAALRSEVATVRSEVATIRDTVGSGAELAAAEEPDGCAAWSSLTDIERTIAVLVGRGLTNRQVSAQLYRSPHTVNYHLRQIFRKLNIRSRVELARLGPPE
jgi:DNA-binding CsgD family transcriptional regulator